MRRTAVVVALLLALILPARALVIVGGSNNVPAANTQCVAGAPTAPSQASAVGYTCAEYDATFTSLANVDTTDTRNSGYALYTHNTWPNTQVACWPAPLSSSDFSIVSGSLVFSGDATLEPTGVCANPATAAWTGGTNFVGKAFKAGFYVDIIFSYAAIQPGPISNVNTHPTLWAEPLEALLGTIPPHTSFTEWDGYEVNPAGSALPGNVGGAEHSWPIDTYPSFNYTNNGSDITSSVTQDGSLHHFGGLVRAKSDNFGVGQLYRYFDNSILTANKCDYSSGPPSCLVNGVVGPNGTYADIDSSTGYVLLISASIHWPITINRITVYCNPSAVSCHQ